MKLTKAQIDHCRVRLEQAAAKRIEQEAKKLGGKPSIPALSFEDQYKLIAAGDAKLKPLSSLHSYTDLNDAYTYPSHEQKVLAARKKLEAWDSANSKIEGRIVAEAGRVLDSIMLGDASDALAAIEKFAAGK